MIQLPFASQHFCWSIRVRGQWNTPKELRKKFVRGLFRVPPDGSSPSAAWRAPPPSTPLRPRTPPPHQPGPPLPEPCKKSQRGWGEEGRRGREGRGFGLREGSSNCNGGWGGPSKHQLGPDPHRGAPNYCRNNLLSGCNELDPNSRLRISFKFVLITAFLDQFVGKALEIAAD